MYKNGSESDQWIAEKKGKPRNYFAAALIVLAWIALAYWAWTAFTGKSP